MLRKGEKKIEAKSDMPKGMEGRMKDFQTEVNELQKKYGVELYAAQVVQPNGEIFMAVKIRDVLNFNVA